MVGIFAIPAGIAVLSGVRYSNYSPLTVALSLPLSFRPKIFSFAERRQQILTAHIADHSCKVEQKSDVISKTF